MAQLWPSVLKLYQPGNVAFPSAVGASVKQNVLTLLYDQKYRNRPLFSHSQLNPPFYREYSGLRLED